MQTIISILNVFGSMFIVVGIYSFKGLLKTINSIQIEDRKSQNQSNLQKEAYFREVSGKDVQEVFEKWMSFLTDMEQQVVKMNEPEGRSDFINLQSKTLMYGSRKTVDILAHMMQYLYTEHSDKEYSSCKSMMFLAYLCSSIKTDFTGYKISPISLIETRIKDMNKNMTFRANLLKAQAEIDQLINFPNE